MPDATVKVEVAPPLSPSERARGRRLAIGSHPMGMTFGYVFGGDLATLALVSLGASEALVGLHNGLGRASYLLQLPTLRAVARHSKRRILVGWHVVAVIAAAPLLAFDALSRFPHGLAIAFTSLVAVAAAGNVSGTVWFPLLRGYVEPDRIGAFFGTIRTGWHISLILFFALATLWLADHEGDYGPLFAIAFALGALRVLMIVRLPERDERTGEPIRVREALRLVLGQSELRRYLAGITWYGAVRQSVLPFTIVMLKRELGLTSSEVVYMTIATFAGGLLSLYLWGRIVDRLGAAPVFTGSALGSGLLYALLSTVERGDGRLIAGMAGFFLLHSILSAGHGVADTRVLFDLTPPDAPARTLVIASTMAALISSLAPIATGVALDALLEGASERLDVYHGFFLVAAAAQAASFWPLRRFGARAHGGAGDGSSSTRSGS